MSNPLPQHSDCIACRTAFPLNFELASIPDASKIAFDPKLHRVWRICDGCGEWNLMGAESSLTAVAELEMRFPLGIVEQYYDMGRSVISGGLQLIRLESDAGLMENAPATAIRHDPAVKKRIKQLRGGVFLGLAVLLWYLYSMADGVWRMIQKTYSVVGPNPIPYAVVLGLIVVVSTVLALSGPPDTRPFRSRAFEHITTIAKYIFLASVTIMGAGFALTALLDISLTGFGFLMSVVGSAVLGLTIVSRQTDGGLHLNLKKARLWSAGATSLGILLSTLGPERPLPEVLTVTALIFGASALLGLIFRLMRHTREIRAARLGTLDISDWSLEQITQVQISWTASGDALTLTKLPQGSAIEGRGARVLLRQILVKLHKMGHPSGQQLVEGEKLLRSAGGLAGIFRSLNQFQAIHEGEVPLAGLPVVTTIAIDLGLTEEAQLATKEIHRLRSQAEDAVDVAKVAEELDQEIGKVSG